MKTNITNGKYMTVICLSLIVVVGLTHATKPINEPPIRFQSLSIGLDFDEARIDAVGKAVDFQNWPQTKTLYVAPSIGKSLLSKPDLVTRESTSYGIVQFGQTLWGKCEWSWDRIVENNRSLPTELPPERKARLLSKLSPKERNNPDFVKEYLDRKLEKYRESQKHLIDGALDVKVCLAPSSRAAQEYLLSEMTVNTMPTDALADRYAAAKRLAQLGNISFLMESQGKDDVRVRFARNNICVIIQARGCFAKEGLPLARKIDNMTFSQQTLTYQQLLARRPAVMVAPYVDKIGTNGRRTVSYDISVPVGQDIARVRATVDGQNAAARNGKINLSGKKGTVNVKLTAISNELLVNTFERDLFIDE